MTHRDQLGTIPAFLNLQNNVRIRKIYRVAKILQNKEDLNLTRKKIQTKYSIKSNRYQKLSKHSKSTNF